MADNPLLITNTDISGVLKNVYEDFRINAFPKLTVLLAQLKKGTPGGSEGMRWGGNGVYWDVVLTRPVGMNASQEGYLPNTAQAVEKQANVGIKRTYVRRQIDGLSIAGTESREAAYISLTRKIMQEAMDAAQLGQQEILHGDGRGLKALVTTVNSTTEIVVQSPYGLAGSGRGGLLLDVGMHIAVLDTSSSDAVLGRAVITAVSNSGDSATLTLDAAISNMAATDKVVACSDSDTSFNNYPNGLLNLLNRGGSYNSLHGISAGTYGRWDTLRMAAGTDTPDASQPSEMDIYDMIVRLANRSGKDAQANPDQFLLLTTPGLVKKIGETFLGQRQWSGDDKVTLKGGFKGVRLCGLTCVADGWCPSGTIYLIHKPSLSWVDSRDWQKLAYEGAGPWRWIPGRDAYETSWGAYWNTAVLQRNSHAMITGYSDAVRYDHVV